MGVGATGDVSVVVCEVKVAVVSRTSGADAMVAPGAVKLTVPEGAPRFAAVPAFAAFVNCAVRTVLPDMSTGLGVAVIVPVLAASAVTVRVIAGVGEVQTGLSTPVRVLQMLKDAVVPTGDDEKAEGTGTLIEEVAVGGIASVTLPKEPKVTVVAPVVFALARKPLAGMFSESGAA